MTSLAKKKISNVLISLQDPYPIRQLPRNLSPFLIIYTISRDSSCINSLPANGARRAPVIDRQTHPMVTL